MTDKHWFEEDGSLIRTFTFDEYAEGASFVGKVAALADEMNHHPEILLGYKTVTVETTTHDQGNMVTDKDRRLAQSIDAAYLNKTPT